MGQLVASPRKRICISGTLNSHRRDALSYSFSRRSPRHNQDWGSEYSFQAGRKRGSDGNVAELTHVREFLSSNGYTRYWVSRWSDGQYTCNCPGWAFKRGDGDRTCKHCKQAARGGPTTMTAVDDVNDDRETLQSRGMPQHNLDAIGQRQHSRIVLRKR